MHVLWVSRPSKAASLERQLIAHYIKNRYQGGIISTLAGRAAHGFRQCLCTLCSDSDEGGNNCTIWIVTIYEVLMCSNSLMHLAMHLAQQSVLQ